MPKEYIEREVISEGIRKYYYKNPPNSSYQEGFDRGLDTAQRVILNAPVADVAPVRHGQWERIGIIGRKGLQIYPCCSACGMVSAAYRSEWEGLRGAWKFCPNCGAKMGADTQEREDA